MSAVADGAAPTAAFHSDELIDTLACINWSWDPMHGYVGGFSRAGHILVDHLSTTGSGQDFLVYPIVYCYRHAIEMALKQVIVGAGRLLDDVTDHPDGHNLGALWDTCKPHVTRVFPDTHQVASKIERVIGRLDRLDPNGEGFRYPLTSKRSGRRPTPPGRGSPLSAGPFR